jgi:trehalose utilization protein
MWSLWMWIDAGKLSQKGETMSNPIRVTVWNEGRHEKTSPVVAATYPQGIHTAIADCLRAAGFEWVQTATLDDPEHGLTEQVLSNTDVLFWWGHMAHDAVKDEIVERVYQRVVSGMGLVVLHSGHFSKIFKRLMGTTCDLKWREVNENERIWIVEPGHPIAEGLSEYIDIEHEEMYGERFDIPSPDTLVMVSWFKGGEVFRSGCCYYRGKGKVFYFRPGHETLPTYFIPEVQKVLINAARWAAPVHGPVINFGNRKPLEKLN